MNRYVFAIALMGFVCTALASYGDSEAEWHEEASDSGLMIVQSHDATFSGSVMDILNRLVAQLKASSGLIPCRNTRLMVRVESWDYQTTDQLPVMAGWASGPILNLQITVHQRPRYGAEDLMRIAMAGILYQSIYQDGAKNLVGKQLIELPMWIVEGLLQGLIDGNPEQNTHIVMRARQVKKTPSLATIMSWKVLSSERLERYWQQAFCFEALQFIQSDEARWDANKKWLIARAQYTKTTDLPWSIDEQLESKWQHFQDDTQLTSDALIFSWDHTMSELSSMQTVTLPATKTDPETVVPFDKLYEHRTHPEFLRVVSTKIADLTILQMRTSFILSSVIQEYRFALASLTNSETSGKTYLQKLGAAQKMSAEVGEYGKRIDDYLNWFEVTKRTSEKGSSFENLFHLQDQLDGASNKMQSESEPDMIKIEKRL